MTLRNVTFKQLRAFVVVAEEGSFVRAAARLHLTPSALTSAIQSLERVIGLRLFDRSTRSVRLTAQAREFLPVAQRLLQDLSDALENLEDRASLNSGSVVVCGATSFMAYVVTPALRRLAKTHPAVRVRQVGAATAEVVRSVLNGEADFGVTTLTSLHHADLETEAIQLLSDRVGVVFASSHAFAAEPGTVASKALATETFVSLNRLNGIRMLIDAERRLPSACRKPRYEASDVPLLAPLLEHEVGIALLPAVAARSVTGGSLAYRPLHTSIWRTLYLVRRAGRTLSPAAELLARLMFAQLDEMPDDPLVRISREPFTATQEPG